MALVEISDELYARLVESASADFRTAELQLGYLLDTELCRRQESARELQRKRDLGRDRQQRLRDRNAENALRVTQGNDSNALRCVTPPSPPRVLPSLPEPISSHSCSPTPPGIFSPAREGPIFLEAPTDEVSSLEETPVVSPPLSAAPPFVPSQPAPKPKRGSVYSEEFKAWWKLHEWRGSMLEAFTEWKAAGLERDDELRDRAMAAVVAQIQNKQAVLAAGGFAAPFKDACRWLKYAMWEENLLPIPVSPTGVTPFRPPIGPRRGTTDEAISEGAAILRAMGRQ